MTIPDELTEPIAGVVLLHVPPGVPSLKAVVAPTHTLSVPDIVFGRGLTVNDVVRKQPVPSV